MQQNEVATFTNTIIERGHCSIKKITRSMMEFKSFAFAKAMIAGIEYIRCLKKGQHKNAANLSVLVLLVCDMREHEFNGKYS
jgi:transposase-like protein